jgi:hypothetical protein
MHRPPRTLQIAILGGSEDAVIVGLRNFPIHKLTLLTPNEAFEGAEKLAAKLRDALRLSVEVVRLSDTTIPSMLETVGRLVKDGAEQFQDYVINVGSASRALMPAAVTAAFVNGIDAFDVSGEQPVMLPVLKLSYADIVSGAKLEIIRAIERNGGQVNSLEELATLSKFGKPLLSYHIRGTKETRGLLGLGLVEIDRRKQGRLQVKLTGLGRIVISTANANHAS